MTLREKAIIQSHLLSFVQKVTGNPKIKEGKLFKCIICNNERESAQVFKNTYSCVEPDCGFNGDIFNLVKKIKPSFENATDEDIADYLVYYLKIDLNSDIDVLLGKYLKEGFYLFPLRPADPDDATIGKQPVEGYKWKEESVKNVEVWKSWINRGYGLGLSLGLKSGVVAVDIDSDETFEKVKEFLPETLSQTTRRGTHYLFKYQDFYNEINHVNLRNKGFDMELRANNSYIAIAPTSVEGENRTWNNSPTINMPENLKEFLFNLIGSEKQSQTVDEDIQNAIKSGNLGKDKLVGLDGCRNDTFVKLAGVLRKRLNSDQTEYALNIFNNLLDKQIPQREIKLMMGQIKKYVCYDKDVLAKNIFERLDVVKEGSAFTLSKSMGIEQKDVEDVLNYLEKEGKIISIGGGKFKRLTDIEWQENFDEEGMPVNFEVPYFGRYANFNWQDLIIVGARSGTGKSSISANIIKQLVDQGKKPYLINTESGGRFGKYAERVGLKKGDFYYTTVRSATRLELPDNAIILLDWLKADNSEFAKIGEIYERLDTQLKKHNSFMIVFEQLKKDGSFFSANINDWFSSFVCTYNLGENNDNINTSFKTTKIRDSKCGKQYITIPTKFDATNWQISIRE